MLLQLWEMAAAVVAAFHGILGHLEML